MDIDWEKVLAFIVALGLFLQQWLNGRKTDKANVKIDAVEKKTDVQTAELAHQTGLMKGDMTERLQPSPIQVAQAKQLESDRTQVV